jgi:phosphoribosylformimino-5-aminoimidazole carboxamide ribotide isomerase
MSFTMYPAIDLHSGRVVRLKEGDPARLTAYGDDPLETALRWIREGAVWLHVVNLDGAFGESNRANRQMLQAILKLDAQVQFGGGIRSVDAIEALLQLGVSRVILGTVAVEQPEIITAALQRFGADRIAVGIDARDGFVRVRGWKEASGIPATELALRMRDLGVQTIIFTDIRRDGLGTGLNLPATKALAEASGLAVIASGGVHTLDDIRAARDVDLAGVIIGRALYEGTVNLREAFLALNHESHQARKAK